MATYKKFSDLDFNFIAHPSSGDVSVLRDDAAIKASVRNLVLTNFYGRPFHPEIGSHVAGLLFENDSAITRFAIETTIKQVIENFEKERVKLQSVTATFKDYENAYHIDIVLSVKGVLESVNVEFLLTRVR